MKYLNIKEYCVFWNYLGLEQIIASICEPKIQDEIEIRMNFAVHWSYEIICFSTLSSWLHQKKHANIILRILNQFVKKDM